MGKLTERGEQQRQVILAAAKGLFARQGFAATGIREIANEAGLNSAMISYYFGSKQGLLETLIEEQISAFFARAEAEVSPDGEPMDKLRQLIRLMVEQFRRDPELLQISVTTLPFEAGTLDITGVARLVEAWVEPIMEAVAGKPIPLELPIMSVVGSLILHFLTRPILERFYGEPYDEAYYQRLPELLTDLLFHGLHGFGDQQQPTRTKQAVTALSPSDDDHKSID